jgi:anti-anti-sigma regulatory factor
MQNRPLAEATPDEPALAAPCRDAARPARLSATLQTRDGAALLELHGRLDARSVDTVEALLADALAGDHASVPCDLSGLHYLSPHAAHRLVKVVADRPACPPPLLLCAASGQPARVLDRVDPRERLPRFPTLTGALTELHAPLQSADLTLTPEEHPPRSARAFVGTVCTRWRLSGIVDDAVLLTSELVTNAVVHADGAAQLALRLCRNQLTIAVRDETDLRPQPRPAHPLQEHGRGLHLVEALTSADGAYALPRGGKVVWCTFQVPTQN